MYNSHTRTVKLQIIYIQLWNKICRIVGTLLEITLHAVYLKREKIKRNVLADMELFFLPFTEFSIF